MSGISGVILAATPLAGIILYFALSGNQQVRVDQQKVESNLKVEAAKFDLDFDLANHDISNTQMSPKELAGRKAEIAKLQTESDRWNDKFDKSFEAADSDLSDLKEAINHE